MILWNSKNKNIRDKLINYIWIKEELPDQWKEPIVLPIIKRVIKLTAQLSWDVTAINLIQHFI
jgi:hypothetical protein